MARWKRAAVEDLYRRHAADAARLAYLLTGNHAVAEDLAQDAFVRAASKLGQVREPAAFGAYLRSTVVNLAKMHFRRKAVERRHSGDVSRDVARMDRDVALGETLRGALMRLPYRQRAALVLRYYVDLPDEESAVILGCAVPTVRSLVSRGTAALRETMESDVDA